MKFIVSLFLLAFSFSISVPAQKYSDSAHYVHFDFSYDVSLVSNAVSLGKGPFCLDLGLNVARFFKANFIAGAFVGAKGFKGSLFQYSYKSDFINAFNDAFSANGLNSNDSLSATTLQGGINGSDVLPIGNYYQRYGLYFKLPNRFFPLIKIFRGREEEVIHPRFSTPLVDEDPSWFSYDLPISWGTEISLFRGFDGGGEGVRVFGLSFFFEQLNYDGAVLYTNLSKLSFHGFLSDVFFEDHKMETRFGLRLIFFGFL